MADFNADFKNFFLIRASALKADALREHESLCMSGYPESDRGYKHPMLAYYHYTISRQARQADNTVIFTPSNLSRRMTGMTGATARYYLIILH